MPSFVEEMSWRGLVHQTSSPELAAKMAEHKLTLYIGFDPTSDSLHVGSLLQILALRRAQQFGHRPIALVGGATGMIGDPSGKSAERNLLSADEVARNCAGIGAQLSRFLDFSPSLGNSALLCNNADWFANLPLLDFLRDIGKHFSVNAMLMRDSVRSRLEDRASGISYTEFSYMLIQAYDFVWLNEHHDCTLQVGGSDQWGNMVSGADLIRRRSGKEAYALTQPLVTNAQGQKFGKTEKGAVWLDAARTSPFEFYQYFLNIEDAEIGKLLRFFSALPEVDIVALDETVKTHPEKREAQRALAHELTALVHGAEAARQAEEAARSLFGARKAGEIPAGAPRSSLPRAQLSGLPVIDALVQAGLCKSKGEARRAIEGGGVYLNDERVADIARVLAEGDAPAGHVLLRKGKRDYHVLDVV